MKTIDLDCFHAGRAPGLLASERTAEQRRLGLDPDLPTGVVKLGGASAPTLLTIARQLPDLQLLLLCGDNPAVAQRLRGLNPGAVHAVVDGSADLHRCLALGDWFLGAPGPRSLGPALRRGLPVLTVCDGWSSLQARCHADWILQQGAGRLGTSWRALRPEVDALLAALPQRGLAMQGPDHHAVPAAAGILAPLFERDGHAPGPHARRFRAESAAV